MKEELLRRYSSIIVKAVSIEYHSREGVERYKAKYLLIDGSNLRVSEVWLDGQLEKYSYYWLDETNNLLAGWDNAPHHSDIKSHPHHLHAPSGVSESSVRQLEDVLRFLSSKLLK
jgi:hypothetical protein